MPSYAEIMSPMREAHIAETKEKMEADVARVKTHLEKNPAKPLDIPKDPNAQYYNMLKEKGLVEERKPLPTSEELQAASDKYYAMSPDELYGTADPAEQLFHATKHLRDDQVMSLLKAGAPTTFADKLYGYTPLHIAAVNGREIMVAHLLDAGAKVDVKDSQGAIPLALARKSCHQVAIKLLEMATPTDLHPKPSAD